MAEQFFTKDYIQHNPNVATGRDAMVAYMKKTRPVKPIEPKITFPVIAIIAEGDLVMIATVSKEDDPEKPGSKYLGTHFDLFRIENGKIAEHWDSVPKSSKALTLQPEYPEREVMRIAKLLPALALVLAIWAWQEWPDAHGSDTGGARQPRRDSPAMTIELRRAGRE